MYFGLFVYLFVWFNQFRIYLLLYMSAYFCIYVYISLAFPLITFLSSYLSVFLGNWNFWRWDTTSNNKASCWSFLLLKTFFQTKDYLDKEHIFVFKS